MKAISSHFFESPHTKLGWWSVGLSVLFMALLVVVMNDIFPFSGLLTMVFGIIAGLLTLSALIWKHERSWLLWLMLIPGLSAIFITLASILIPH